MLEKSVPFRNILAYKPNSHKLFNHANVKATLGIKILNQRGELIRGNASPVSYTFENKVTLLGKQGSINILGWGNNNGNYYTARIYHYEVWYKEKKLYSVAVNIKDKPSTKSDITNTTNIPDNQVYESESVDEMPEFPYNGTTGLVEYLNKNRKYPAIANVFIIL